MKKIKGKIRMFYFFSSVNIMCINDFRQFFLHLEKNKFQPFVRILIKETVILQMSTAQKEVSAMATKQGLY